MRWFILCFMLFILVFNMSSNQLNAKETKKVVMVTWRGETDAERGFKDAIAEDFDIDYIFLDAKKSKKNLPSIIQQTKKIKPDLIYTFGTSVTNAMRKVVTNIPIVFTIVMDPIGAGIAKTMQGSGTNVAGATHAVPISVQFSSAKRIVDIKRMGIIYNPAEKNSIISRDVLREIAKKNGFKLIESAVTEAGKLKAAAQVIIDAGVDMVYLPSDSFLLDNGSEVVSYFNQKNIPTLGATEKYVKKCGALVGVVTSYYNVGKEAAGISKKIFEGQKPGNIPIFSTDDIQYVLNMKTAQKIGLEIPMEILEIASTIIK